MEDKLKLEPEEFKSFIQDTATIASASKIYYEGIQYVDNASFWEWITQSYKNSQYIDSAESMKQFINLHGNQLKGIQSLLQGKGLEWDVFRDYRPHLLDINKLPLNTNAPVSDVSSYNLFSGLSSDIQVKTSLSNANAVAKGLFNYPETTKFAVNQSIYDEAVKLGLPKERFIKVIPDNQLKEISDKRFQDAASGNVEVGISLEGTLKQVGKGALIGAVFYIGVSAISNYRKYKMGQMSFNDFGKQLLKDGTKGGIMGGSMAAINVGVQWSLVQLGLGAGNPIAIPVMIVISYGLKKIIDPMFKDGKYAEILQNMQYNAELGKGYLNFGKMCVELYDNQKNYLNTLKFYSKKSDFLNKLSNHVNENLDNLIKEI